MEQEGPRPALKRWMSRDRRQALFVSIGLLWAFAGPVAALLAFKVSRPLGWVTLALIAAPFAIGVLVALFSAVLRMREPGHFAIGFVFGIPAAIYILGTVPGIILIGLCASLWVGSRLFARWRGWTLG